MKFVIDRSKWVNGSNNTQSSKNPSALQNELGNRCCLGFFSLACGVDESLILDMGEMNEIPGVKIPKPGSETDYYFDEEEFVKNEEIAKTNPREFFKVYDKEGDYIDINDNIHITNEEREQKLKERFALDGIEVEFVGEHYVATPSPDTTEERTQ